MGTAADERVLREYAGLAPDYDRRWACYTAATLRETLKRLDFQLEGPVLDVGCGTGSLLWELQRRFSTLSFTGVDASPEMLVQARSKLPPCVALEQASAEALPYSDAAFRCIFSTSALHHFRDPERALREMTRILAPGGHLLITDWCGDARTCRALMAFLRCFRRSRFHLLRSAELGRWLEGQGLEDISVERYRIDWLWKLMTARARKAAGV